MRTIWKWLAVLAIGLPAIASDLAYLNANADAIVVGAANTFNYNQRMVSFDLNIERVIRGTPLLSTVHVSHELQSGHPGAMLVMNRKLRGIWFLHQVNSSTWDVLPVDNNQFVPGLFYPAATGQLPSGYQYDANAVISDVLTFEIAAGIDTNQAHPELILGATTSLNSSAVGTVFSQFLSSSNPAFQAVGLAGFLQHNLPNAIPQLVRLWPVVSAQPLNWQVLSALGDYFRDTTPGNMLQLVTLAENPSTPADLRAASVRAISATHTKETLPFLASLLTSSNAEEQRRGVFGLSSFANGCPPLTPDNYASMEYLRFKNPSPYRTKETMSAFLNGTGPAQQPALVYWQQWWGQHPELH